MAPEVDSAGTALSAVEALVDGTFRYEIRVIVGVGEPGAMEALTGAEPVTTVWRDGTREHLVSNLAEAMRASPASPEEVALYDVEVWSDGSTLVYRAPMVGLLSGIGRVYFPPSLRALGEEMGLVDLGSLAPAVPVEDLGPYLVFPAATGYISPTVVADRLAGVGDDVSAGKFVGEVTVGEVLAIQHVEPGEFLRSLIASVDPAGGITGDKRAALVSAMSSAPGFMEFTLRDDRLTEFRIGYALNDTLEVGFNSLAEAYPEIRPETYLAGLGPARIELSTRISYLDWDDPEVEVVMPETDGLSDVTEDYPALNRPYPS